MRAVVVDGMIDDDAYGMSLQYLLRAGGHASAVGGAELGGQFTSEMYAESQYMFLHMDSQMGGMVDVRLDPARMEVVASATVPLLGLKPPDIALVSRRGLLRGDEFRQGLFAPGGRC